MKIPDWVKEQYDLGICLMNLSTWLYWDEFIKFAKEEKIDVNNKEECELLLKCWNRAINISSDN